MKVTELYYLIENLRYILLSEHMYFPAISPFLSDRVTYEAVKSTLILFSHPINYKSCNLDLILPFGANLSEILQSMYRLWHGYKNAYNKIFSSTANRETLQKSLYIVRTSQNNFKEITVFHRKFKSWYEQLLSFYTFFTNILR